MGIVFEQLKPSITNSMLMKNRLSIPLILFYLLVGMDAFGQPGGHLPQFNLQPKDTVFSKNKMVVLNASGDTLEISELKNGRKHGVQKLFFNNSELRYRAVFKNGLLNGKVESFQQNRKEPVKIEYYKAIPSENRSVLDGLSQTFDYEGNPVEEINYKNGLKNGKYKFFHPNGRLKQEGTYDDELDTGRKRLYDTNGILLKDENFIVIDNPAYKELTQNNSALPEEIPNKPKSISNAPKRISVLHGKVKYYFQSGRISADLNFNKGQKEGLNKEYYDNPTSSPRSEVIFKNGKEHGAFVYYRTDGNVDKKGIYYAEIEVDGVILKNIYDGENIFYQENGQKSRVENWKNYKRNGVFETYTYRSGTLSTRTHYKDNLLSGTEQHFDKDGKLVYEVNYEIKEVDGQKISQKTGVQKTWENGKLTSIVELVDGKRQGFQKTFFPNGNIKEITFHRNDTISGTYQKFYETGQMKEDLNYYRHPKSGESYFINWNKKYDEDGSLNQIFYGNLKSKYLYLVDQKFKNKRPLSLSIEDFLRINYSEFNGSIESISWSAAGISFNFFTNGILRSLSFTNVNYNSIQANFAENGELIQMKDVTGKLIDDSESEEIAKTMAKQFNKEWHNNPAVTILENNGNLVYDWKYADGKPFFHIEFKDSLPNGNWVVLHPVRKDSLFYGEFDKGKPVGKWTKKRYDGSFVYQKEYDENSKLLVNKDYNQNGKLSQHTVKDEKGNNIIEERFYENGQLKEWRNSLTKSNINFNEKGDTLSYNLLKPGKDSIIVYKTFYENNKVKVDEIKSKIDGNGTRKYYFENGKLRFYNTLKNWKKDGIYEEYNENGKLIKSGFYKEGKKEGEWITYLPDGHKELTYFKDDELIIPERNEENQDENNCKCYDTSLNKSKIGFANSLNYLVDYSKIKPYIPKTIVPIDDFNYEKIFYLNPNFNEDRTSGFAQMRLLPLAGFSFYYPAKEYLKIDLIPCQTDGYVNNIRLDIRYSIADQFVSYASLYPRRFSMELMKNPLTDAETKKNFKAFFDTEGIDFDSSGIRNLGLNSDKNACYSKGLIKDFIFIKVLDANPVINPNNQLTIEDLPILPEESSKFYGLDIIQSEIEFEYTQNSENIKIHSTENKILAGSNFVAGRISIYGKSENEKEFLTKDGQHLKTDLLKTFLEKKGFYRLKFEITENKLILWFYAEK